MKKFSTLIAFVVLLVLLLSFAPLQVFAASGPGYEITASVSSLAHGASGSLAIKLNIPASTAGSVSLNISTTSGLLISGSHTSSGSISVPIPQPGDSYFSFSLPYNMTNSAQESQKLNWSVDTVFNGDANHYTGSFTIAVEHTYGTPAIIPPLCEEQGYSVSTCTACGSENRTNYVPATGHDWGAWIHDGATSGAASAHKRVCANDSNHTESKLCLFSPKVIAPTCTKAGYTRNTCGVCKYSYKSASVAALGHDPGEWKIIIPATGYKEGVQARYCTRCGIELDREATPKLNGMRYGNTACALGQRFRDTDPALTDKWYMFTPVDLSAEGVQSFPLIAANMHYIGDVQVTVQGGSANIGYTLNSGKIKVKEEFLTFFSGLDAVTTVLPEEMPEPGVTMRVDIPVKDILGESAKGLLYLRLVIDYDIYANGIQRYREGMFD